MSIETKDATKKIMHTSEDKKEVKRSIVYMTKVFSDHAFKMRSGKMITEEEFETLKNINKSMITRYMDGTKIE